VEFEAEVPSQSLGRQFLVASPAQNERSPRTTTTTRQFTVMYCKKIGNAPDFKKNKSGVRGSR